LEWTAESSATIPAKVAVGENGLVGAGRAIANDVPANTVVAARILRSMAVPVGSVK